MWFGVFVLLASASCAKIKGAPVFDEPLVQAFDEGDFNIVVIGTGAAGELQFEMRFEGGAGNVHMPTSLKLGNTQDEMLAVSPQCNFESKIGIGVFPALVVGATTNPAAVRMTDIRIDDDGPLVARIATTYTLEYGCGDTTRRATGGAVFTFFPSGRIAREDQEVRPTENDLPANAANCSCMGNGSSNGYVFSTYYAFPSPDPGGASTAFGNFDRDNNEYVFDSASPFNSQGACSVYDTGQAIGVQFRDGPTSRLGVNNVASHVHDFMPFGPTLPAQTGNMRSQMQFVVSPSVTGAECDDILARLDEPSILVNDIPVTLGGDGIYSDSSGPHTGPVTITVPGSVPVPPGFVVALDLDGGEAEITREPAPSEEPVARAQRLFDQRFLFVFTEGLAQGATITIEPK